MKVLKTLAEWGAKKGDLVRFNHPSFMPGHVRAVVSGSGDTYFVTNVDRITGSILATDQPFWEMVSRASTLDRISTIHISPYHSWQGRMSDIPENIRSKLQ